MKHFSAALCGIVLAFCMAASTAFAATPLSSDKPVFTLSQKSGVYSTTQIVSIISDKNAEIYYTTDGTTPTQKSNKYAYTPIVVRKNTVIKVAAYINGALAGSSTTSIIIRTPAPKASVSSGTYSGPIKVKLTCSDSDAVIYYTTDGTPPTKKSKKYTGAITISDTTTLKFVAYGDDLAGSTVVTKKYTITSDAYDEPHRQALFEAVNKVRAEYGLAPLEEMPELSAIAQQRAVECSTYFSHYRPNGSSWYTLLSEYGLKRNTRAENIAYYYPTAQQALNSWLNDPAHRQNILNPNVKYIGIGYYNNGGCSYWTQLFLGDQ